MFAFKIEKDNLEIVEFLFQCSLFHLKLILFISLKKLCRKILGYDRHPSCLSFLGPMTARLSVVSGFYLAVYHNPILLASVTLPTHPTFSSEHISLFLLRSWTLISLWIPFSPGYSKIPGFCEHKEIHVIQPHIVHSLGSSRGIFQEINELLCCICTDEE